MTASTYNPWPGFWQFAQPATDPTENMRDGIPDNMQSRQQGRAKYPRVQQASFRPEREFVAEKFGDASTRLVTAGERSPGGEFLAGELDPNDPLPGHLRAYARLTAPGKSIGYIDLTHLDDIPHGHGLGQQLYLIGLSNSPHEWHHSDIISKAARRTRSALLRRGYIESFGVAGNNIIRLTPLGREVASQLAGLVSPAFAKFSSHFIPRQIQFAQPAYTHARAPTGGITIQGRFYRGGEWIPKEVLEGASPEEQQNLADAGIVPQGGGGGDQSMNTGSQLPGSAGDDPGGGPMGPPMPSPPRMRPRRLSIAATGLPPGQTEPHGHVVDSAADWLQSAGEQMPLPDPDDENAWVQAGVGPDMLPGMMLSALASRGHKAGKMIARGFVQHLGPAFPQIAQQVLPRLPAAQLLGAIAQHPDIQQHLAKYSLDPQGQTLADQRVLWRAVRTSADNPAFGTLAGQAMADAVLAILQPPQPQDNPDLQGYV